MTLAAFFEVGAGLPFPPSLGVFGEGRHIAAVRYQLSLFQKFVAVEPSGGDGSLSGRPVAAPYIVFVPNVVVVYPLSRRDNPQIERIVAMNFHRNSFSGNMMSLGQTANFPVFPHTEPATLIPYRIRSYRREGETKPSKMSNFPVLVNSRNVMRNCAEKLYEKVYMKNNFLYAEKCLTMHISI
jgi:hypothetical protein